MPASNHPRSVQLWGRTLSGCLHRSVALPDSLRHICPNDISALGLLFFAAFRGTVDEAGQTEAQYALKASAILGGRYGQWIPEASRTWEQTDALVSAWAVLASSRRPRDTGRGSNPVGNQWPPCGWFGRS